MSAWVWCNSSGFHGRQFDPLVFLLGHVWVIATGDLSVSQLAIRKSLHSDSYPLPPAGSPQEPCIACMPQHLPGG